MESTIVTISDGQLKGSLMTNYDGSRIYAFRGIPYAEPAFGNLRFKPPKPIEEWKGVKDATKNGNKCIQQTFFPEITLEGSEDCLHVNVFSKQISIGNNSQLKPVMVWIHGGGFYNGSNRSELFGPGYLLTEDVVLVTVNYRLGIFGFLKAEDPSLDINGNVGLKDQQLALKWVQKNIHVFGGDPNNVTLFGESAGGSSVHYHILSSSSKGLFHKAILQSGVSFNRWATEPIASTSLIKLVEFIGVKTKTEKEALEILRTISTEELYMIQQKYMASIVSSGLIFVPVPEESNDTAFITKAPLKLLTSGEYNKVPMILGYNSAEGIYMEIDKRSKESKGLNVPDRYYRTEEFLPKKIRDNASPEIIQKLCTKLLKVYENDKGRYMMISDAHFIEGIVAAVKIHAKISHEPPIYFYRMDIDDDLNIWKRMGNNQDLPGMSHIDDIGYLFTSDDSSNVKKGSSAEIAMRRIVKLWTNFAKFGNPTPFEKEFNILWDPVTDEKLNFIDIGRELTIHTNPEPERMKLWEEIRKVAENY